MILPSADEFNDYSAPLLRPEAGAELAARTGMPREWTSRYIAAVCNEAQTGLRLLKSVDMRLTDRILEVGAGGGLLTGFLQSRGLNLVAIEPVEDGFEATPKLVEIVRETTDVEPNILRLAARDLDLTKHGTFDLIFSVNVIEHFQPLNENLDALALLMSAQGVQIHTCPNYRIPYEPHYGIPLLPFSPRLTPFLGARRSQTLWRSLNFITASDLWEYAERWGLKISLARGSLGEAFERLCAEPAFAARHPATLRYAARAIRSSGLLAGIKRLPPEWVTPMTAVLRRL